MSSLHAPLLKDIPDQTGRAWLITGATNGVGREVARAAARAGAHVIVPARDVQRGHVLAQELTRIGGRATVHRLDLADLSTVYSFAAQVTEPVDVLVNNAGMFATRRRQTADGFELVLGTNFLGPFALTNLLAHTLRDRVVVVGSGAHTQGRIDVADPHFRHRRWTMAAAYSRSKLSDMLWAVELQRRLAEAGRPVIVQLAHPGWAYTNLQNATGVALLDRVVSAACSRLAQPPETAARSVLAAALADLPPLSYVGPDGWASLRGEPAIQQPAAVARDTGAARAVWDLGVRETGTDL